MKEQNRKKLRHCFLYDCHINSGLQKDHQKCLISNIKNMAENTTFFEQDDEEVDRGRHTVKEPFSHCCQLWCKDFCDGFLQVC